MTRQRLADLESCEYEHPFDHQALVALEATPGLDTFIQMIYENIGDDYHKIILTGSAMKVTKKMYRDLYDSFQEACEILNLDRSVDLFVQVGDLNAFTVGVGHPVVVLNTALIDVMTDYELLYVIGHELGHVKSQHCLYHTTASLLAILGSQVGELFFGIGDLLLKAVQYPILHWSRMSEFTADRAGLLVCQDTNAAIRACMKMAGVPDRFHDYIDEDEFLQQAEEFEHFDFQDKTSLVKVLITLSNNMSHPWIVTRAAELKKWVDTGDYGKVMKRETRIIQPLLMLLCQRCNCRLNGDEMFCPNCGWRCQPPPPIQCDVPLCGNCGSSLSDGGAFCPRCGSRYQGMPQNPVVQQCENCGFQMYESKNFCPACGRDLKKIPQAVDSSPEHPSDLDHPVPRP